MQRCVSFRRKENSKRKEVVHEEEMPDDERVSDVYESLNEGKATDGQNQVSNPSIETGSDSEFHQEEEEDWVEDIYAQNKK